MKLKSLSFLNLVCLLLIVVQAIGFFVALDLLSYQKKQVVDIQKETQSAEPTMPTQAAAGELENTKQIKYVTEDYIIPKPELAAIFESKLITKVWPQSIIDEKGQTIPAWWVEAVDDKNTNNNTGSFLAYNKFSTFLVWEHDWEQISENERCMTETVTPLGQAKSLYANAIPNILLIEDTCYFFSSGSDELNGVQRVSLYDLDKRKEINIYDPSSLLSDIENTEEYLPSKRLANGSLYGGLITLDRDTKKMLVSNEVFFGQPEFSQIVSVDFITGRVVDSISTK
jgi:hypothetical protein